MTDHARTPTEIDTIAEAWLDTYLELAPEARVYLGRAGQEAEYSDYSPAGHEAMVDAERAALATVKAATAADEIDRVTKLDLTRELSLSIAKHEAGFSQRDLNVIESPAQRLRDLFDLMNLDEKKREAVLAILKERVSKQTDLGLSAVDANTSAADRKLASDDYTKFTADAESKLKELLGDGYAQFDRFEKSQPEREHLKTLNSMLKEKSLTLDEATETKLMDAMYETRRAFKFDRDLSDTARVQPNDLSRETVDRYAQQHTDLQRQIQEQAKGILSAEQLEVFVKSQESQQQMSQLNLQMLRQMSGEGKTADGRN